MRKFFLGCLAVAFSGLVACSDLPTAPKSPETDAQLSTGLMGCPRGPGGENCYTLPPVSGGPTIPACDPWMDANWCKGDQCIMGVPALNGPEFSGIASCPIGGGPIGGPGGPGTGGPGTGGPTVPKPPLPEVPGDTCNTGDPVVDDPSVSSGLQNLWAQSNPDANLWQRVEKAGWIVRTATGYSVIPITTTTATFGCAEFVAQRPANGAVVGFVHTHPYQVDEAIIDCDLRSVQDYTGAPSDADRIASKMLGNLFGHPGGLPGYIIDKDGYYRFTGSQTTADPRLPRCGY
jgi:hypothetical protein